MTVYGLNVASDYTPHWSEMAFPRGAQELAALRAAATAVLYPGGLLTTGADATDDVTASRTLPTGCAAVKRYTFNNNGGRAGGTPMYAEVLEPEDPIGVVMLFCDGHRLSPYDTDVDEHLPILADAMAAGIHVIVQEMPQYGRNPDPATVVIDGVPVGLSAHVYPAQDSGPTYSRLYTDPPLRAINQVAIDYPGSRLVATVGMSGGGTPSRYVQMLLSVPRRYGIFDWNPWCVRVYQSTDQDFESYDPAIRAALGGTMQWMDVVSAAVGQESVTIEGDRNYNTHVGSFHGGLLWMQRIVNEQLKGCAGTLTYWNDQSATQHEVTTWASSHIIDDIVAHLRETP